jgi:hypothetical protein
MGEVESNSMMASIRVGFFEDFKGADTLLLKTAINQCPGAVVPSGLHVDLSRTPNDTGLLRTARTEFMWQRSEEGWAEVIEKLGNGERRLSTVSGGPKRRCAGHGKHRRVRRLVWHRHGG